MKSPFSLFAFFAVSAFTTAAAAQVVTVASSTSSVGAVGFNSGGLQWGQTFVTPDDTHVYLETVSFWFDSGSIVSGGLKEWTAGGSPVEPFIIPVSATSILGGTATFDVGSVELDSSKSYIWWLTTSNGTVHIAPGSYAFGGLIYANQGVFVADYTSSYDLIFSATFSDGGVSPVPEPATYATVGLALCGALALGRRSRRHPAAPLLADHTRS